jgi:hypothetical protein
MFLYEAGSVHAALSYLSHKILGKQITYVNMKIYLEIYSISLGVG